MSRLLNLVSLTALVVALPVGAQERIEFDDYRLDNGLRVVLVEDQKMESAVASLEHFVCYDHWKDRTPLHLEATSATKTHMLKRRTTRRYSSWRGIPSL